MFSNDMAKNYAYSFYCILCHYGTCKKSSYDNHLLSRKHKKSMIFNEKAENCNTFSKYSCKKCGKEYKDYSGLWRHRKKCDYSNNNKIDIKDKLEEPKNELNITNEIFLEFLKQNQEFQKQIFEFMKTNVTNISNTTNNNNNCYNKTFNLQFFLNEKCKDALNINEFIDSLKISFSDLENIGENGFVNGISKIFVNGLKSLDVYKRPIHCSDLKRETMYLKEDNIWEKDNENKDRLKKAVKLIAHKNMLKINDWKKENPQYKNSDSKKNDQYLKMLISTAGPTNKEDEIAHYEKIISNIAKEVTIDKDT